MLSTLSASVVGLLALLGNSDVHLLVLDGHDHVPVLVVAEDLGARLLEAFERLGSGVTVGVVRANLDNRYLGLEAVEEERRRGGVRAMMRYLENDKGSEVQNGPFTSQSSLHGVISKRSLRYSSFLCPEIKSSRSLGTEPAQDASRASRSRLSSSTSS